MSAADSLAVDPTWPTLLIEKNQQPVLRFKLVARSLRIGSHPRNDVSLPGVELADFFAELRQSRKGHYRLLACAGQQIEVNGQTCSNAALKDGDRFALGKLTGHFVAAQRQEHAIALGATGQITISHDGSTLQVAEGVLVYNADSNQQRCGIGATGLRIGKDPSNDLVLDEPSVSGFHALVYAREGRYFVRDLDSTNGTLVNELKVVEAELPFGGELRLGRACLKLESQTNEATLLPSRDHEFEGMISADATMRRLFSLIERVALHDASVLVTGETGAGKELVARALHRRSPRARAPFVAVDMGALPHELIESELFGHEKGAFSGAHRARMGAFEQAQGGTLFLDEIGELPIDLQPKLLRVLETRQVRRLGAHQSIELDVRLICATHRNLVDRVAQGLFREDLLHRVYVLPIELPPLRERHGDLDVLCQRFLKELDPQGRSRRLTAAAFDRLRNYPWPGNVRELRNVLQRAVYMCPDGPIDIDAIIFPSASLEAQVSEAHAFTPGLNLAELERGAIERALDVTEGNRSLAAELLGISRSTLLRKLKQLKLALEAPSN